VRLKQGRKRKKKKTRNKEMKLPPLNEKRRMLLKFGAIGAATFVLGKVFGPSLNFFSGGLGDTKEFKNFRVVDNDTELGIYDTLGNEILIIEKEEGK